MRIENALKEEIRALACVHGFDLCRFTRPTIASKFSDNLDKWLAQGFQAGMAWMAEEGRVARRKHPASMLQGVRTVICLAMRHTPPAYSLDEACAAQGRGVIASYAYGFDYHDVMKKRMKALARDLDAMLGEHDQRVYVDTAPVLEHALAAASGLGWQGKHSLTIHRELGSYFLLGELFTTAEIEPDAEAGFHCGTCTACMDVCPTKAIAAPFFVDARLCISWQTIENRGWIPRALRLRFGNRIYGCDDCQMVCPWNRHAIAPESDFLVPQGENILPGLASLLALDDAGFRARFRKSPVKRIGRDCFVRNCCVAAGNSGDATLLPQLVALLDDASELVRGHAAWAVGRLADDAACLTELERAAAHEQNETAHEEMILSIEYIRGNI